jgi:succinate-semialdehyde dehydrogenase/glutarate-semialdehyde dehydrogenase
MSNVAQMKNNQSTNQTINPATGDVLETYSLQTSQEVEEIINQSHAAYLDWRGTDMNHRIQKVRAFMDILDTHKNDLAMLMATEMGKPITQGIGEVERCIAICEYTVTDDLDSLKDDNRDLKGGKGAIVSFEPIGIVFGIQPWNFPLYQVVRFMIPTLVAGNAVILKHAKNVWGMAKRVEEMMVEAGFPDNLFRSIFIENEQAEAVIEHQHVRAVTLTGSAKAGSAVAKIAGANIKKSVLELGGADPYIVLDDATIDTAVNVCVMGRIANSGQTCVNAKRFIVLESVYDAFKEKFVAAMKNVSYGDPTDPDTKMGPLAREDLREKLHDQVTESVEKGAVCLVGGEMPDGKGYFYPASVLENIKPGMPAYDDELFGPVAGLFKAKDEDDAIRIANDHRYGLGGGVLSADEDRAIAVARRLETGMVSINGFFGSQPNLPFGGTKDSGYGREHGGFGIREFVNIKSIMIGNPQS